MSFILLLVKVDLVLKKQSIERDKLVAFGSNHVKVVFTLLTKVLALYIQTLIVQIRVLGIESFFLGCKVWLKLTILLALNK